MSKCTPVILALCALSLHAQPATTQLVGPIYNAVGGTLYTGSVSISLSTPGANQSGAPVQSNATKYVITNGVFVAPVNLVPNDTMSPTGSYYILRFNLGDVRYCTIPTSGAPVTVPAVCIEAAPATPLQQVTINQLVSGGVYAPGLYCVAVSSSGAVTLTTSGCPGSGGGGGLSWSGLTSSQWSGLTSSQWSGLSN